MPRHLSRRTLLAGVPAVGLVSASVSVSAAAEPAYGAFRVVRRRPGEPSKPTITLPDGYEFVAGDTYSVASRAEFYTFVTGPRADAGIPISVRWPGVPVDAVIHQDTRLRLRRSPIDPYRFSFRLPMDQPSTDANQPTLQVWSHPDISPGMYWRIEHNDADRVAGPWTTVPWPAGEVRSVIHQLVAMYAIWRDSSMIETAAAKGHRLVLMGFETNNAIHPDNPPHWHMSYNSGADFDSPTHNPHFWIDASGGNFYNGMDVTGLGRLKYYVGDPAPIYDFVGDANDGRGNLVVTITIRADGGLDITPPDGVSYAMAAGRNGDLLDEVTVLRDGAAWLRVATRDRVKLGVLTLQVEHLGGPEPTALPELYGYDPLTGVLV